MELINKRHLALRKFGGRAMASDMVTISATVIYFPASFAAKYKLTPGRFIHFINEGKDWSFICNDDPDGFVLNVSNANQDTSVRITFAPLCRMIMSSLKITETTRYYVSATDHILNECPVFEIFTHRPVNQIGKQ